MYRATELIIKKLKIEKQINSINILNKILVWWLYSLSLISLKFVIKIN